jgi:hypothetical protein
MLITHYVTQLFIIYSEILLRFLIYACYSTCHGGQFYLVGQLLLELRDGPNPRLGKITSEKYIVQKDLHADIHATDIACAKRLHEG